MAGRGAPYLIACLACFPAPPVLAGAWPMPVGQTQAILKYEGSTASRAYDANSVILPIAKLRDETLSLFLEHGLTSRLTLQAKLGVTRGSDAFIHYAGRGPAEIGLRYTVYKGQLGVLGVYAGAVAPGVGRNAGYAAPHAGGGDLELRLLGGRSATLWGRPLFGSVEVARLFRRGLPDETHLDVTLGMTPSPGWLLLVQSYGGRADATSLAPRWVKAEASLVRHLGPWSLQAGWRATANGRETPVEAGPVIGLWRRF